MYRTQTGRDRQSAAIVLAFNRALEDKNWNKALRIADINPDIIAPEALAHVIEKAREDTNTKTDSRSVTRRLEIQNTRNIHTNKPYDEFTCGHGKFTKEEKYCLACDGT